MDEVRLERGLAFLQERGLIDWFTGGDRVLIRLNQTRSAHVPYDEAFAAAARKRSETRLADMVRYARSTTCRRRFLLGYYGETAPESCGTCDVCLGRHAPLVVTPDHEPLIRNILEGIRSGADRRRWFSAPAPRPRDVTALIDWLEDEGFLVTADRLNRRLELTEKAREYLGS